MNINPVRYLKELIFTKTCVICGEESIHTDENMFCMDCAYNMPYTSHLKRHENQAYFRLKGKFPFQRAASMINFDSYTEIKNMIHRLKYEHEPEIGEKLGKIMGSRMNKAQWHSGIDLIIPVPIHKTRRRKRGYNQAAMIAKGMSEIIGIPWDDNIIEKHVYTVSQTKLNRKQRLKNVLNTYRVIHPDRLIEKHILIVDDVLTTGATLEACANEILKISGTTCSLATICLAR